MHILKRKVHSAGWRLKTATHKAYQSIIKLAVELLTERYWLLDYLPAFSKKRDGILLVRLDLIGDFVLWLDSAQVYRRLYPNQKITVVVSDACKELALALPHWDEVIGISVPRLRIDHFYRLRTLVKLRLRRFSIAIQPTFSRELVGDLTIRATCASDRIGYHGKADNILQNIKLKTDTWYTKLVMNSADQQMELNINAHFVRQLGCTDFVSRVPMIPIVAILKPELRFTDPYIVVAPGASWAPKMWPLGYFSLVLKKLMEVFDIQIVICGGPDDVDVCGALSKRLGPTNVHDVSGKTTLPELVEIVRDAHLLITNDSAPVHIAAAVNTKSVCILGGGHFGRFLPYSPEEKTSSAIPTPLKFEMPCYGCGWSCIHPRKEDDAVPCISSVSPLNVQEICLRYLSDKINSRKGSNYELRTPSHIK